MSGHSMTGRTRARHLRALLQDLGVARGRPGFEADTAGLTDHDGQRLRAALPGIAAHSDIIRALAG